MLLKFTKVYETNIRNCRYCCDSGWFGNRCIQKNLKNSISIKALCTSIGTSERTLHQGFKERFGVSPKAYMQLMRLNGVRQDLLMNNGKETISDSAMRWGFFHLGRFSAQYKQMFYELPNATLSRVMKR